ncbi:hypothetical protein M3649_01890 [Ureibacillus chungkukjangi]|nr:hypothetical protein [Ureibacillus chungkukjangi]
MKQSNLKVVFITMEVTQVLHSLLESAKVVGLVESKRKNPSKQTNQLRDFCSERNLPYYFMNDGCSVNFENWLKELEPDLIVIFGMSELLKKNIIDIPKKGCINLHPSLLPKYRGGYPIFWMYYHFDLNPGVTVHYIDEGEDTGNIIYQESINLPIGATEEEFFDNLINKKGIELLLRAIEDIEKDCAPSIQQQVDGSTKRARQIRPEQYKEIIDWETWDIVRIWHLLRGTQNWLNVFDLSEIQGDIKKWRILNYSCEDSPFELGKVFKEDSQYFVSCGQGKIYMELTMEQSEEVKKGFAKVVG